MDPLTSLERALRHIRLSLESGDIDLALMQAKKVRRTSTLLVRDIANTRDTLHVQEDDKP